MALIQCEECGRQISDRAAACPGCGAPVQPMVAQEPEAPEDDRYTAAAKHSDGRLLRYDEVERHFDLGEVAIATENVLALDDAGEFEWIRPEFPYFIKKAIKKRVPIGKVFHPPGESFAEKLSRFADKAGAVADALPSSDGTLNPSMVCPHCQAKGRIRTKIITQKKGISGGKATAAILTGGASMLATGLSRKEHATQAHCESCGNTWSY